jgi:hypothetical protein
MQANANFERMPTYKNRPPMPADAPVWRYLSLDAVIATIERRQLRLTRIETFLDPFEGSVTKKHMEDQNLILASAESRRHMMNAVARHYQGMPRPTPIDNEDPWARITRLRRARTPGMRAAGRLAMNASRYGGCTARMVARVWVLLFRRPWLASNNQWRFTTFT